MKEKNKTYTHFPDTWNLISECFPICSYTRPYGMVSDKVIGEDKEGNVVITICVCTESNTHYFMPNNNIVKWYPIPKK